MLFFDKQNICACCGKSIVAAFEVCKVCGWENDWFQNEEPDIGGEGGANIMSLNEARQAFKEGKEIF